MVTLAVALDEFKTQLAEVICGSLEKGFELVAGYAGTKLAKSVEGAVKNAELVGKGGGYGEIAGLREQIKDNAAILIPIMDASSARGRVPACAAVTLITDHDFSEGIRVITVGNVCTGGTRALLYARTDDAGTKPRMLLWSHKHELVASALKELLDITQDHLKLHLSAHVDPPSPPAGTEEGWTRVPYPSFSARSPTASNTATVGGSTNVGAGDGSFWDTHTVIDTNQSGGFNYRSSGTSFDPDGVAWSKPVRRS